MCVLLTFWEQAYAGLRAGCYTFVYPTVKTLQQHQIETPHTVGIALVNWQ